MLIAQLRDDLRLSTPSWAFVPLRDLYIAIALICAASSALAVAQSLGWHPVPQWNDKSSGLMFNSTQQGAVLALCVVALAANRLYWFIPALAPGLYLAHSRGAWAALGLGLLANWFRKPLYLAILVLALGLVYSYHLSSSDLQRLVIWHAAWQYYTLWGNGFDTFQYLWIGQPAWQPLYMHNDYLQAVFEFGVLAVIPFSVVAWALSHTSARDWPTFVTFAFLACFSMPMHMPLALILGLAALASTLTETSHA